MKRRIPGLRFLFSIFQPVLFVAGTWCVVVFLDPGLSFSSSVWLQMLNVAPAFLFGMLLWSLSQKFFSSLLLTSVFFAGLYQANQIKLEELSEPIITADFLLLHQLIAAPGLFVDYLKWSGPVWCGVVFGILLLFGLLYFERPLVKHSWVLRSLLICLVGIGFLRLVDAGSLFNQLYQVSIVKWKPWEPRENAENHGLVFTLVKDAALVRSTDRKPDVDVVDAWKEKNAETIAELRGTPAELPDIVVILSEAFFDPGILRGVRECTEIPNFCHLARRGVSGYLTTPAFGGKTLRAEFEILTGVGLENFPEHTFPYFTLVTREIPSIAWDLAALGYQTVAVHPFKRAFWNRHVALELLGFQRYISQEEFHNPQYSGHYVSDREVNKKIIEILSEDHPQFIFAITMENHGPWGDRRNIDHRKASRIAVPRGLPPALHRQWQEYIYHLRRADRALAEFAEFLRKRKRHTVLLFFGDHLPGLGMIFESLGFDSQQPAASQPTKFLVFDNRSRRAIRRDVDAEFLTAQALYRAGLLPNDFFVSSYLIGSGLSSGQPLSEETGELLRAAGHLQLFRFQQTPVKGLSLAMR